MRKERREKDLNWSDEKVSRGRRVLTIFMICTAPDIINTLITGSFKLFKRPFPGFLTILTL